MFRASLLANPPRILASAFRTRKWARLLRRPRRIDGWHVGLERLAAAGIPADAAQRMADAITEQRTPPAVHVRAMKADDGSAMEELQAESRPMVNHHPSCTRCILE